VSSPSAEELKAKAASLSSEAEAELKKAVHAVQPKKQIKLYSSEYYYYCTIGGILGKLYFSLR
jgi:HJR/Mrr/RecB family endonuclease